MLPREKFRELVFVALYSLGFHADGRDAKDKSELVESLMNEYKVTKANAQKAVKEALAASERQEALDDMIEAASKSFDLTRIQTVERAILRLIFFELIIERKIEIQVAISEGKRLARKFATDEAAGFVHALIDAVLKEAEAEVDAE